ncbi:hypothetical protein ACFWWS_33270 [Streptomyces sp. NPDC059083]
MTEHPVVEQAVVVGGEPATEQGNPVLRNRCRALLLVRLRYGTTARSPG